MGLRRGGNLLPREENGSTRVYGFAKPVQFSTALMDTVVHYLSKRTMSLNSKRREAPPNADGHFMSGLPSNPNPGNGG